MVSAAASAAVRRAPRRTLHQDDNHPVGRSAPECQRRGRRWQRPRRARSPIPSESFRLRGLGLRLD